MLSVFLSTNATVALVSKDVLRPTNPGAYRAFGERFDEVMKTLEETMGPGITVLPSDDPDFILVGKK